MRQGSICTSECNSDPCFCAILMPIFHVFLHSFSWFSCTFLCHLSLYFLDFVYHKRHDKLDLSCCFLLEFCGVVCSFLDVMINFEYDEHVWYHVVLINLSIFRLGLRWIIFSFCWLNYLIVEYEFHCFSFSSWSMFRFIFYP